jgi:hypothetical protein
MPKKICLGGREFVEIDLCDNVFELRVGSNGWDSVVFGHKEALRIAEQLRLFIKEAK